MKYRNRCFEHLVTSSDAFRIFSYFVHWLCPKSPSLVLSSAMPPDVRRRLAAPTTARLFPGYAPGSGLALRIYWAIGRTQGIAPSSERYLYGGAEPPSHIRRQSRT